MQHKCAPKPSTPLQGTGDKGHGTRKLGGRGSCRAKFSANREVGKSADWAKGWAHREVCHPTIPESRMISALKKLRHQPLAKAGGMVSVENSRGQTDALK